MGGGGTPQSGSSPARREQLGSTAGRPGRKDGIRAMALRERRSLLLMPLLLLVTRVQPGAALESINYIPQIANTTLLGRLTQSTFTLEQPLGQFENVNLSDPDPIWLVVAHSNATQNFTAPQKIEDTHAPASFDLNGYYVTMRASRVHYQGSQSGSQLRVLRVGNDTHCSSTSRSCNPPLPGAGPYRVKFLAMNATGPAAETKWSKDIHLQQAQMFQGAPESRSKSTVIIIALLSILLVVFLVLVIAACCWRIPMSSPAQQVRMRRYHTHHTDSLRAERSS